MKNKALGIITAMSLTLSCVELQAAQLSKLIGSWQGNGTAQYADNKNEKIKCNAYYTGESDQLNIVVRCASTNYNIHLRSKLQKDGNRLSGTWEERTFNLLGDANGVISHNKVRLTVSGPLQALMTVNYSASNQTVNIRANGSQLEVVSINLNRMQ